MDEIHFDSQIEPRETGLDATQARVPVSRSWTMRLATAKTAATTKICEASDVSRLVGRIQRWHRDAGQLRLREGGANVGGDGRVRRGQDHERRGQRRRRSRRACRASIRCGPCGGGDGGRGNGRRWGRREPGVGDGDGGHAARSFESMRRRKTSSRSRRTRPFSVRVRSWSEAKRVTSRWTLPASSVWIRML